MEGTNAIRLRMKYLCEFAFGGNVSAFGKRLGVKKYRFRDALAGEHSFGMPILLRVVKLGFARAEWLFCGTGPMQPAEDATAAPPLELATDVVSSHPHFDTFQVQYELPRSAPIPTIAEVSPSEDDIVRARLIHAARSSSKPVVLFLGHAAIAENVGPLVNTMLEKGYITGVALSSAAAMRDFERAVLGGRSSHDDRLRELAPLNVAALRAAASGMGYGEALGRWSFPLASNRAASVLARAYELQRPATVHLTLGDSMHHLFPATHAATLGAALGAASYVDMLIFAAEARQMAGTPSGILISADEGAQSNRLFSNVLSAYQTDWPPLGDEANQITIGREYRHTFPALLSACDAVYDGTADDVRRMRRK